jgi:hypothetical protein
MRSAYTSRVIAAFAWPSMLSTAFTVAPAETARLAAVWCSRGPVEPRPPRGPHPQHRPHRRREHEVIGCLPGDLSGDAVDQEPRHRHPRVLMRHRQPPVEAPAVDLLHRLGDVDTAAQEVDAGHLQCGELTPPQTGVREDEDDQAAGPSEVGEVGDLLGA